MGSVGKVYDGGAAAVDADAIARFADATDDPNPAYRGPAAVASPMFHVRPFRALMGQMAHDPELELDYLRLVHGEHAMNFLRLVRPGDRLELSGRLVSLEDKPSGRIATFSLTGAVRGEPACEGTTTYFIRAENPPKSAPKPPPPDPGPPTFTQAQRVAADQARRYADASGDDNPIHLDPATAAAAGLPGPILHGLCTLSFAQRDLVDRAGAGDPGWLTSISARWIKPVRLDTELQMSAWRDGSGWTFATRDAGGALVLTGRATGRS
ncbi:MAG: MaoC/PaaZ C-terminal domain-containing protein [Myxococcota bacterium]